MVDRSTSDIIAGAATRSDSAVTEAEIKAEAEVSGDDYLNERHI